MAPAGQDFDPRGRFGRAGGLRIQARPVGLMGLPGLFIRAIGHQLRHPFFGGPRFDDLLGDLFRRQPE